MVYLVVLVSPESHPHHTHAPRLGAVPWAWRARLLVGEVSLVSRPTDVHPHPVSKQCSSLSVCHSTVFCVYRVSVHVCMYSQSVVRPVCRAVSRSVQRTGESRLLSTLSSSVLVCIVRLGERSGILALVPFRSRRLGVFSCLVL